MSYARRDRRDRPRPAPIGIAPMSFPAMTRCASGRSSRANARTSASTRLRGVSLPRNSTTGPSPRSCLVRKSLRSRDVVLVQIHGIGDDANAGGRDAEAFELRPLGLADRENRRRALQIAAADGQVVHPLGRPTALEPWRRAIRREHIRDAGRGQPAHGNRNRQVPAGVQVGDVELPCMGGEKPVEAARQEALQMIGEDVGRIGKHVNIHAIPHPGSRGPSRRGLRPLGSICGICRANSDGVAARAQFSGKRGRHAGNTTVAPGVGEVRRDVQYTQRHFLWQIRYREPEPSEL